MRHTDAAILACWRKHDAKRVGKRGPEDRNAVDDAAEELGLLYSEVQAVVRRWMEGSLA